MSQLLVMPINNAIITATYKTDAYQQRFKTPHFGVDMYSKMSSVVFACGKGKVVCAGKDNVVGNTVVIIYDNVWNGNKNISVAARCFHLKDILVKKGQTVNKDTIIGHFGATGMYVEGAHLHIEFDSEPTGWQGIPKLYPTPSTFFYRGSDTMIDPCTLLHTYTKDNQKITWSTSTYNGKPFVIKKGFTSTSTLVHNDKPAVDWKKKYEEEVKAHNKTKEELEKVRKDDAEKSKKIIELEANLQAATGEVGLLKEELDKRNEEIIKLNNSVENLNEQLEHKTEVVSDFLLATDALFSETKGE